MTNREKRIYKQAYAKGMLEALGCMVVGFFWAGVFIAFLLK